MNSMEDYLRRWTDTLKDFSSVRCHDIDGILHSIEISNVNHSNFRRGILSEEFQFPKQTKWLRLDKIGRPVPDDTLTCRAWLWRWSTDHSKGTNTPGISVDSYPDLIRWVRLRAVESCFRGYPCSCASNLWPLEWLFYFVPPHWQLRLRHKFYLFNFTLLSPIYVTIIPSFPMTFFWSLRLSSFKVAKMFLCSISRWESWYISDSKSVKISKSS